MIDWLQARRIASMQSARASRRVAATLPLGLLAIAGPAAADTLDSGDTAWILTSTALVLFMTLPGLALFYSGLVGNRNVLSVMMQCFAIACAASLLWVITGYSLTFGEGEILGGLTAGMSKNMLAGITADSETGTGAETLFVMFQMTFAIITPALIVGGFAERIRFSSMLFLPTRSIGLGVSWVSSPRRRPNPPAIMTTLLGLLLNSKSSRATNPW